ncbi:MAG: DAK2 domain-containing protein [Thermogemmatispora sp.]|uniref:DAK2 domain-containing protein n=1 Tax=Thermogemmatispora sp. TaxID=1968838 RepID=UPI0019EC42B4|nr:DAK2 domain-containing protein [Thermogemmatispora sp.]MBE3564397.1 DAK2 domain-containing protein [Thermogemmatispora sp.]
MQEQASGALHAQDAQSQQQMQRISRPRRISVLDGQDLKKAMIAGAAWLEERRESINALNVFPVPDGDTGSNMSATMQAAIRGIIDSQERAAGVIASRLAHDALLGARGNSGVILSQVLRGLAQGLEKKQTFTSLDLANALMEASRLASRAVIKPVEGTILTVVRDCAEAALASAQRGDDLVTLMHEVVTAARQSVARTPELLPILKQAGVVDAGGQGLCVILEGIWHALRGEGREARPFSSATTEATPRRGRVNVEEEQYGYEVVFLLRGENLDVERIRQTIIDMGGVSTVVAGDEKLLKVHTHTQWPGKILDYGVSLGSLLDINIENLQEQSLAYAAESRAEHEQVEGWGQDAAAGSKVAAPSVPIATVAVVSGSGFEKVYRGLGVSAIVPGGQTMNPSIEELLAAVNSVEAEQVIILPNNSNVILSAQQIPRLTSKQVEVIPTETLPQGIAALMSFNYSADLATNVQSMSAAARRIQTAEITTAVRAVQIDGLRVREGDIIGLINGNLAVAGSSLDGVISDLLQRMHVERYELLTIYYGEGTSETHAQETAARIKQTYSHLEVEVVDGGQPYYTYIFSVE